eukprot:1821163-Amphidinium_carterae.1
MVAGDAEVCDLPESALGKHSREAVKINSEGAHGLHRPHAPLGECSHETVDVDVEPCDLPESALGKHSREAVT